MNKERSMIDHLQTCFSVYRKRFPRRRIFLWSTLACPEHGRHWHFELLRLPTTLLSAAAARVVFTVTAIITVAAVFLYNRKACLFTADNFLILLYFFLKSLENSADFPYAVGEINPFWITRHNLKIALRSTDYDDDVKLRHILHCMRTKFVNKGVLLIEFKG